MYLINIHTMNVFFKESYECIYTHWNFKKQMSYRINANKKHSYGKIFCNLEVLLCTCPFK